MRHEEGPRARGAVSESVRAGQAKDSASELTTDDLKSAAVLAFHTNTVVRVCDQIRCVDVVPDTEIAELVANGTRPQPTWLEVRSSVTFPGRVAYVYSAGVAA